MAVRKSTPVTVGRADIEAKKGVGEAFPVKVKGGTVAPETITTVRSKAVKEAAVAIKTTVAIKKSVFWEGSSASARATVAVAIGRL